MMRKQVVGSLHTIHPSSRIHFFLHPPILQHIIFVLAVLLISILLPASAGKPQTPKNTTVMTLVTVSPEAAGELFKLQLLPCFCSALVFKPLSSNLRDL